MTRFRPRWLWCVVLTMASAVMYLWPVFGVTLLAKTGVANSQRAEWAEQRVREGLTQRLRAIGSDWGAPVFVRIFKRESELEVWARTGDGTYALVNIWPICAYSGELGPKLREGDGQAPEGIYHVGAGQLNPLSSYHLSFDLGYPNGFDRANARTGSFLMVHGSCVSIGCYAMTDDSIDEIYSLVAAALTKGQPQVQVHALPFRFASNWERDYATSPWRDFWRDLAVIDARFEADRIPPDVRVRNRRYRLR